MALDLKSEEGKIMFSYSYHIPPQEQLSYFQRMVERLTPPRSSYQQLLRKTYLALYEHHLRERNESMELD
ncbi:hypothetical protein QQ73_03470 [Candidatus Endoriftia persephone str. Guaymas]|jgi:beta-lactamase class D|nr:hypothetical protein [Candidatus Endoriftia persephone str. Guaymas]